MKASKICANHVTSVRLSFLRCADTYTKLSLMNASGAEVQRCKTSVRRGQPNPLFKETFMLQVALFQLAEVTLMVSVYNKKSMKKKEMVGWFAMGKVITTFRQSLILKFSLTRYRSHEQNYSCRLVYVNLINSFSLTAL